MKNLLVGGKLVSVDNDIYELVKDWNWRIDSKGYVRAVIKLHKLVGGHNKQVDHINRDKLDNCKKNLRLVNDGTNQQNRKPKEGYPFKGVYWNKRENKWKARIGYKNERINLGTFVKLDDALTAYNEKALELYGKHAYTNLLT